MKNKKYMFLSAPIAAVAWLAYENLTIKTTHYHLKHSKLPKAFQDFKIAHLSDVHNRYWGNQIVNHLLNISPDIIVITGDLLDGRTDHIKHASTLIHQIKDIAPIYYVPGNHEAVSRYYAPLKEKLFEANVTVLENTCLTITRDQQAIELIGMTDPKFSRDPDERRVINQSLETMTFESDTYRILLSHRPEHFDLYCQYPIDLILSGHAHGGQVRIPFVGGVLAPNQGLWPKLTSGVHHANNSTLVISRGLGNSVVPIRVNNQPEIVSIRLN